MYRSGGEGRWNKPVMTRKGGFHNVSNPRTPLRRAQGLLAPSDKFELSQSYPYDIVAVRCRQTNIGLPAAAEKLPEGDSRCKTKKRASFFHM